jgi:hypothetical protein
MKINNLLLPHPVLGHNDDYISGSFVCTLSLSLNPDKININVDYDLQQEALLELINSGRASYVTQIYCNKTFFRGSYINEKRIEIDTDKLRNEVRVDFWIVANEDLENLKLTGLNDDYGESTFNVKKSEILAYGGQALFIANKTWEDLKAIKSLIDIQINSDPDAELAEVIFSDEKIIILLPKQMHKDFAHIQGNEQFHGILHSSLVLPALIMAINRAITYGDEYKRTEEKPEWLRIIESRFNDINGTSDGLRDTEKTFKISQMLIDNPLSRELTDINNFAADYYGNNEIEL